MAKPIESKSNAPILKFKLEPYKGLSTRHKCPSCNKNNSFARFIDITTGQYLGDDIGRCNREVECGYHKSPSTENVSGDLYTTREKIKKEFRGSDKDYIDGIDSKYVLRSISNLLGTNFVKFLISRFEIAEVMLILERYKVGRSDVWDNSNVFWQIDSDFNVRTGKIMLYNLETGKRVKVPFNHINWAHTPDKGLGMGDNIDYNLGQCFFGEHLVNSFTVDTPVRVVESEKTAIICSILKPNQMWVATGGLNLISEARLNPYKDRKMIFYPDKGKAKDLWIKKLEPFKSDFNFTINTKLEEVESVGEGEDMADYILNR